jgi:hypothetical protein
MNLKRMLTNGNVFIPILCLTGIATVAFVTPAGPRGPLGWPTRCQPYECVNNLRVLDGAKEQFKIEHGLRDGNAVTIADLEPYLQPKGMVTCPAGGKYEVRAIGEDPTCSLRTNEIKYTRENVVWYRYTGDSGNAHRLPR